MAIPPLTLQSKLTGPLMLGSKNADVKSVQGQLNFVYSAMGQERALPMLLPLNADGAFGLKTDKVVRDFQRRKNLVVDGVVGQNTAKALGYTTYIRVIPPVPPAPRLPPPPPGQAPSPAVPANGYSPFERLASGVYQVIVCVGDAIGNCLHELGSVFDAIGRAVSSIRSYCTSLASNIYHQIKNVNSADDVARLLYAIPEAIVNCAAQSLRQVIEIPFIYAEVVKHCTYILRDAATRVVRIIADVAKGVGGSVEQMISDCVAVIQGLIVSLSGKLKQIPGL